MEQEFFFSGYCRQVDGSRTVVAVTEDGCITESDCLLSRCPHNADCPLAEKIRSCGQEQ